MRIDNATPKIQITPNPVQGKKAQGGGDFGEMLTDAMKEVNSSQLEARDKKNLLMTNQPVDVDDLMITMEKASTAMQLTMQVRNKVLEAYQELSRMQV